MTADPVGLYAAPSRVPIGGRAVTVMYGPVRGGLIVNPASPADQGIPIVEELYVSLVGDATVGAIGGTVAIQPGQSFTVPTDTLTNVTVNAATSGHRFSAITFQPSSPVVPAELVGETNTSLQEIIPSYLYQQYTNDDDLQAFVAAYNQLAQEYLTWLNETPLAVYTSPAISGDLLDWIAAGLYGVTRPIFSAGVLDIDGTYNTFVGNSFTFNGYVIQGVPVYQPATDDIFKRVLTWKLYKGDGKILNIRWLKRRVMRFLTGVDGTSPDDLGDTQQISVTFSDDTVITLTTITESAGPTYTVNETSHPGEVVIGILERVGELQPIGLYNNFLGNAAPFNAFNVNVRQFPRLPNVEIFKQAVEQGVLTMPFQFKITVVIQET